MHIICHILHFMLFKSAVSDFQLIAQFHKVVLVFPNKKMNFIFGSYLRMKSINYGLGYLKFQLKTGIR